MYRNAENRRRGDWLVKLWRDGFMGLSNDQNRQLFWNNDWPVVELLTELWVCDQRNSTFFFFFFLVVVCIVLLPKAKFEPYSLTVIKIPIF